MRSIKTQKKENNVIVIDGRHGEGGGQILRSALSLSAITQQAFRIEHIRAKRKKPGLLRQHLASVQAAARISNAQVIGAQLGATTLEFVPQNILPGNYSFAIGSAGSTGLVLQTVLPLLMQASAPSTLVLEGGTHNPMAPPFDFLQRAFLPLLARMGVQVDMQLIRPGFFPAGGGRLEVHITPAAQLQPLQLTTRGITQKISANAYVAGLPTHIAERELAVVKKKLQPRDEHLQVRGLGSAAGPGNMLAVSVASDHVEEIFCGFGQHGVPSETIANQVCREAKHYIESGAAVGEHLADQLLLPFALAGEGVFTCSTLSEHTLTNIEIIQRFLSKKIVVKGEESWHTITVG